MLSIQATIRRGSCFERWGRGGSHDLRRRDFDRLTPRISFARRAVLHLLKSAMARYIAEDLHPDRELRGVGAPMLRGPRQLFRSPSASSRRRGSAAGAKSRYGSFPRIPTRTPSAGPASGGIPSTPAAISRKTRSTGSSSRKPKRSRCAPSSGRRAVSSAPIPS